MLLFELLILTISLYMLMKSAAWMSNAAIQISQHLGVPSPIIGATIISLATTLPETITSIIAGIRGHNQLAIGNTFGSPAANLGLILGLTLLLSKPKLKTDEIKLNIYISMIIIATIAILFYDQYLTTRAGIFLILTGIIFLIYSGIFAYKHTPLSERIIAKIEQQKHKMKGKELKRTLRELIQAAVTMPIASYGVTQAGIQIAKTLQVPEYVIGFTMISIGTSLPEIALAITLYIKKRQELSFGNLTGASILTLTIALGAAVLFEPFYISPKHALTNLPLLLTIFVSTLLLNKKNIPPRMIGGLLITLYAVYLINTIVNQD